MWTGACFGLAPSEYDSGSPTAEGQATSESQSYLSGVASVSASTLSRPALFCRRSLQDPKGLQDKLVDHPWIESLASGLVLKGGKKRSAEAAGAMCPEGIHWYALQSRQQHLNQFGMRARHEGVAPPERFELSTTRFEVCYSIH